MDPIKSLAEIKGSASTIPIAIQRACEMEATAPKAGNVHPDWSFDDLTFQDFLFAAKVTSEAFASEHLSVSQRALNAVREVRSKATNVNLGIVLLLTPLVAADESNEISQLSDWLDPIRRCLDNFTSQDSENLFNAIRVANPGGLGRATQQDVHDDLAKPDILAAMKIAESRDRVAKQYATGFRDLFATVIPEIVFALQSESDPFHGIAIAHIRLLQKAPDTLIARKCGLETAVAVQNHAIAVDVDDPQSRDLFDQYLRSQGHKLNPGTTADMIAASLYVLMRTPNHRETTQ